MTRILITGSNRGIGLEFARQYDAEGARVFATCRHPENAEALNAIAGRPRGHVSVHRLDVTSDAQTEALADSLHAETIDILINNAGLGIGRNARGGVDYALWEELFRVNTIGPLRVARAFRDHLLKSPEKKIITITSTLGSIALNHATNYPYASSKAAVNRVMHSLSAEWRNDGFTVVLLHPGWVKTEIGGPNATLDVANSVAGMRKVIASLSRADNGQFLDYAGRELPW
ncbi:MAG: SDR family oxidoreductase [Alphaproteobacteria bacterium]